MSLKTFTIPFQDFSIDPKLGLKDYSPLYKSGSRLKNFLINKNVSAGIKSGRTPSRFNEEYRNGDYDFLTMQDVDIMTFSVNKDCVDKITDYAIEEEKTLYQTKKGALIVSNAMTLGLSFITDRPIYINQNVFEVDIDETKANKTFVLWYLNLVIKPLFQTTYTAKYLSKDELGRIKIPLIPLATQNDIVSQIKPIEDKIASLRNSIIPAQEIINRVFAREFDFDLEQFEELQKDSIFTIDFSTIGKQNDLRLSAKHSRYSQYLQSLIAKYSFTKFEKLFTANPQYGANETSKDAESGDIRYIRITDIDDIGNLLDNEVKTAEYVDSKYLLQDNDFLFARSGNTVGKSFLYNSELHPESIFAGYFIKFNFDIEKLNPVFMLYYSKSFIFEVWKNTVMRTMGQPNINAEEYKTLPILDIPPTEQARIVHEIKTALDAQTTITDAIASERAKIDQIIEQAIV